MSDHNLQVQEGAYRVPAEAATWQSRSLIVGVVGAVLCVVGFAMASQREEFLRGYLIGYMFWWGLSLGCLALLMLQYLTGGLAFLAIRRFLEAGAKGLPLMLVLFLPILLGRHSLYAWMNDPALTARNSWYLNQPAWVIRWLVYFAISIGLTYVLTRRGDLQDRPLAVQPRFQGLSGVGLLLYTMIVSFGAVDWVMSLDPRWGSTIYGLIFLAGQGLTVLSFSVIMLTVYTRKTVYHDIIKPMQFHDLGKLMSAFVLLCAYFSFSQWLIIWAGNLPEEIGWFLNRIRGGWGMVALIIILFHFALPFALLLSRERKRAGSRLIKLAILLLFMRLVDIYWYVVPNFAHTRGHFYFSIWYLVGPAALGGLWLAYFFYNLRQRPILPAYEPQMPNLLHQGSGHGH